MGQTIQDYALVVMTNKDVYQISKYAAERLERSIEESDKLFKTSATKSGSELKLQVSQVSAIVTEAAKKTEAKSNA